MVISYEFLNKDKWTKELAVFDTQEQADNFISILKDNKNYRDFRKGEINNE